MWFKLRAAFGSWLSVLDCDVIIHNQGSVLSGFLNTRKLVKARDRRRSAFVLFFVVFLLNWFLKRVNFIISKIKNNNRKNIMHIFIFCFLLLQYQMCIFASKCDEMCFCSFLARVSFT